jgi:hypothetical protein
VPRRQKARVWTAGFHCQHIDANCLFFIGGLVVLATATLLGVAGFVRHRVGLAGLVSLLLLIRLILLCHRIAPVISRRSSCACNGADETFDCGTGGRGCLLFSMRRRCLSSRIYRCAESKRLMSGISLKPTESVKFISKLGAAGRQSNG